ncbi:MAG TPA: ABC transporter ATP-binding protein [Fimbriimonadaceae bacterium]|nr:ABC transporter ATP-binding protein [Fimbriimonadaceae bacterium]
MISAVLLTLLVTLLQIVPPRLFQTAIDSGIKPPLDARRELAKAKSIADSTHAAIDEAEVARWQTIEKERSDQAPRVVLWTAVALFGVIALRNAFSFANSYTLTWIGHRFVFDLRFATWKHLQRLSLAYHNQTQTGKIMARVTGDIELIQGLIQGQLVTFISDIVTLIAVIGMLFYLEWRIALCILGLIPFYVISYLTFLRHIREVSQEQRRLWDEMLGKLAEKIAGIGVVKAFVREDAETQNFMDSVQGKFNVDMRQVHLNRRLGLVSGVISAVGTGIVYAYGGSLVQSGELTTGALVALTFYIAFVFNPAVRVVDFNNSLQWALAAMERVFQTLDTRPDIEDRPGAIPLDRIQGRVEFRNVSFEYVPDKKAIDDVSFTVEPGEVIALVGHSGAGKSTLLNLLMRFYDPTEGAILIDGHDLRELRLESVRRRVAMVAQENVLFSVSILENVKYGNPTADSVAAIEACKAADLDEFVMSLPDGYDTMIGEDGIKLSGGQKQRLALARALLTDPAILILDDVTSALDGETEAKVQEALVRVMAGRTTFIIAHRLSSVVDADRIYVVEAGQIVDCGTHSELVSKPGIYRDIYREQFKSALQIAP